MSYTFTIDSIATFVAGDKATLSFERAAPHEISHADDGTFYKSL